MDKDIKTQLFNLIENIIEYYIKNENDNMINELKLLHNSLESFDNFKLISYDLSGLFDNLLIKYEIEDICIISELIFNHQFIIVLLSNYDKSKDINYDYHISLCVIIISIITLFEKYIEENLNNEVEDLTNIKNILIKNKIKPYITYLQLCFNHVVNLKQNNYNYDEEISNIMELLCDSGHEEIYCDDMVLMTYMGLRNKNYAIE